MVKISKDFGPNLNDMVKILKDFGRKSIGSDSRSQRILSNSWKIIFNISKDFVQLLKDFGENLKGPWP